MIDPATSMGTPGQAMATFGVLRSPKESHSVEVVKQGPGGCLVVMQGKMDGWSLWRCDAERVTNDTVLKQVKYATSREELFDAP